MSFDFMFVVALSFLKMRELNISASFGTTMVFSQLGISTDDAKWREVIDEVEQCCLASEYSPPEPEKEKKLPWYQREQYA